MNVLSYFDGMSCGQLALNRLGFQIDNYFACEIDKYAIQVTQANFPKTRQLGDVKDISISGEGISVGFDLISSAIPDLLIGGSPCQGFSFAGKQLNFNDPRSVLFFEFVRTLKEIRAVNPDVKFFLENVKMKKEYQNVISELLGVQPIEVNSAFFSAQNRKRLYWTNIEGFSMPEDKGILLKDIVHEFTDLSHVLKNNWSNWLVNNSDFQISKKYSAIDPEKAITMTARQYASWNGNFTIETLNEYIVPFEKTLQILDKEVQRGKVGYFRKDSQANRVYYIHDKAVTLCGDAGGGAAKMGQYLFGTVEPTIHQAAEATDFGSQPRQQNRIYNIEGKSVALHLDASRTNIAVPLPNPETNYKKFYTLTAQDKHGVLIEGYIRKLTPVECERLQTVPDNYTNHVSNSQRYKMLGNGWTVDVISEFFKHLKQDI